jgi:hypothetical protein
MLDFTTIITGGALMKWVVTALIVAAIVGMIIV